MDTVFKKKLDYFLSCPYNPNKEAEPYRLIDSTYGFSNEDLRYIHANSCKGRKRALVVAGGGDHSLNLIANGIMEIDTFDINDLTEYYIALKRAMIMKYSFQEFRELVLVMDSQVNGYYLLFEPKKFTSNDIMCDIIEEILSAKLMDEKYQEVWRHILDFYNENMKDKSFLTDTILHRFECGDNVLLFNNYLRSKAKYELLKERLPDAKITFTHSNVTDIADTFKGRMYDMVLLSNTLDYAPDVDFVEFVQSLDSICNPNAIQFLHYIFWYASHRLDQQGYSFSPIINSGVNSLGAEIISKNGIKVLKRVKR